MSKLPYDKLDLPVVRVRWRAAVGSLDGEVLVLLEVGLKVHAVQVAFVHVCSGTKEQTVSSDRNGTHGRETRATGGWISRCRRG